MTMGYRRFVMNVFLLVLAAYLLLALAVFVIDPFQHYREASFYMPMFDYDYSRYLNPGMARNFSYDTAVIGTSMVMNFTRRSVMEAFGGDMVNLAILSATMAEQRLMLDTVIEAGRADRVIYGLDIFTYDNEGDMYGVNPFPFYLYDDNVLNDYRYLFNHFSRKASYSILEGNLLGRGGEKFDRDHAYNVGGEAVFGRQKAIESYRERYWEALEGEPAAAGSRMTGRLEGNFDSYILPVLKANTGTRFEIFYPPYSYLHWALYLETTPLEMEDVLEFKRHVYERTRGLGNVRVYDFQSEEGVTFNLDNYMDINHFSFEITRWIVNSMAEGRYLVTGETLPGLLGSFAAQMGSIDLDALHERAGIGQEGPGEKGGGRSGHVLRERAPLFRFLR